MSSAPHLRQPTVALLAAILLFLAACTPTHELRVPPAGRGGGFAGNLLPGRYAVFIDTTLLDGRLQVGGACKDAVYPMNMRWPFESRLRDELTRRLAEVEFITQPLSPDALRGAGYAGQISVRSTAVDGVTDIERASLAIRADIDVKLRLVHAIRIEDAERLYADGPVETAASAEGEAVLDVCESVADTMGVAFGAALETLIGQIDRALAPLRAARRGASP